MSERPYVKLPSLDSPAAFRACCEGLGLNLPCDDAIIPAPASPMAQTADWEGVTVGNRWCIQPMEGWDGTEDGLPTDLTRRRWQRFGESGAKLIWGGEAVAVRHDGRANPNQLVLNEQTAAAIGGLRDTLLAAHGETCGTTDDLLIGLQLTHSGRFCKPNDKRRMEPQILYRHPILDRKFGLTTDTPVFSDEEIDTLSKDYARAAVLAQQLGFQFVDLKHCHGYLGHEFLSAYTREGRYGGSFENRTRFLRELAARIRQAAPGLGLGVRISAFDFVPFRPDPAGSDGKHLGAGIPEPYDDHLPYRYAFGTDVTEPVRPDLDETFQFLQLLLDLDIRLVNITAGSPYYNPHIQRPAVYPPSDGYQPPEDPLVGVERQVRATAEIKRRFPQLLVVGSAYTYLQDYLPHVGQAVVREGWVDFVGLGRMVLSYPELPHHTLTRGQMEEKRICRTFSDCTTAPRNGLVSGCYPLDPLYKGSLERRELIRIKSGR